MLIKRGMAQGCCNDDACSFGSLGAIDDGKCRDIDDLRKRAGEAKRLYEDAQAAFEADRARCFKSGRRQSDILSREYMRAYNHWDKLSAELSWLEGAALRQSMSPSSCASGGAQHFRGHPGLGNL